MVAQKKMVNNQQVNVGSGRHSGQHIVLFGNDLRKSEIGLLIQKCDDTVTGE